MDNDGGFHEEEKDGKIEYVYHHQKYQPIPQLQNRSSIDEEGNNEKLLFLCPHARRRNHACNSESDDTFQLNSSPEYILSTTSSQQDQPSFGLRFDDHPVSPLFFSKTNIYLYLGISDQCSLCHGSDFEPTYYICETHRNTYHKQCVESPLKIKHPYHPDHSLQLFFHYYSDSNSECLCCRKRARYLVYHCTICLIFMHPVCAMKSISFILDPPKRHNHPLSFFPRQTSLTCNVCGLLRKIYPTYICARCNFVTHMDCMHSPHIIKISRHHHRISFILSLPSGIWSCGVCRQSINGEFGAYTCQECDYYAVHSRCALRRDVWDGKELQGVLEEDDITKDLEPFDIVSEGVILHFLHGHHLRLEVNQVYDDRRICQACVRPIYEASFFSCMECSFNLHETCSKARRRIQHPLHPHPVKLMTYAQYGSGTFYCDACSRLCGGFVYKCPIWECKFDLDIWCASISEPFDYKGHNHPLFLSLDPEEKPTCVVCQKTCRKQLNCITCDFIVCIACATLPYKARYKHDKHFLTVLWGEEVCEEDWCEMCECNLRDTNTKVFYWCNECCTTLHIECLLGKEPYLKPGQFLELQGKEVQVLEKSNLSRPFCESCKNPCQGKVLKRGDLIACSTKCCHKII